MEPIIGVLLGGFLVFNAVATPGRAARTAEKALQKQFPGATINVEIKGKRGRDVLKGRFKSVRVEMSHLNLDTLPLGNPSQIPPKSVGSMRHLELVMRDITFGGLPVESVQLSFDDVEYDLAVLKKTSEIRMTRFSNGKILLKVTATALAPVYALKLPDVKSPTVSFKDGQAIFTGSREVFGVETAAEVRGTPVGSGGDIELGDPVVKVSGVSLPTLMAKPLLADFNPLYRFDPDQKWPFRVNISKVKSENDAMEVEGVLTLK